METETNTNTQTQEKEHGDAKIEWNVSWRRTI